MSLRRSAVAGAAVASTAAVLLTILGGTGSAGQGLQTPLAAKCAYTPTGASSGSSGTEQESPIDERYNTEPDLRELLGAPTGEEVGDGIRFRPYENGRMYWSESTGPRETHGDILTKYLANGGHEAFGAPITDECPAVGNGKYNHFTGTSATGVTSIYWRLDLGAHILYGPVREHWEQASWEGGLYGYPTSDTSATRDGAGLFNDFAGGDNAGASIYWSPDSGGHGVKGAIRDRWLALDAEQSFLGYPTSDEYDIPTGKRSDFQGGYITWNASTGEVVVFTH
ncbi:hypothetical protein BAY61_22675 [Prauserella marina]|uniref:LGFP repeat-containing protein n=1 Tax=Prauserella marina TaxID=530584 RepID=A0A222VTV8_9PSEU|nr:hypothetical protein [Prauserella marina]ASR37338.1 hypothetical protein BAY61_22675 [Prauserella marina]PWV74802.1 LGFP repeat-containing protein [Prauserella marina]SDD40269.1 LGFP repeat-containing protein [Prauserella marina]